MNLLLLDAQLIVILSDIRGKVGSCGDKKSTAFLGTVEQQKQKTENEQRPDKSPWAN